jgi:hypothetical protein
MSKGGGVKKHCSILNYVRNKDAELYDLIQDLCIGRFFVPKGKDSGITFLFPDKALVNELKTLAEGNDPEAAVEAIRSMILLMKVKNLSTFANNKNIPTHTKNVLKVKSGNESKVMLENGAEITHDKDFGNRKDRENIAVYSLSKQLVQDSGEPADLSKVKSEVKEGGVDLSNARSRQALFEELLKAQCKSNCDLAMELLVQLYEFFKGQPEGDLIKSQCSYDTLASLAIILQPYKSENYYIEDVKLTLFINAMIEIPDFKVAPDHWCYVTNPVYVYDKILAGSKDTNVESINQSINSTTESIAKTNIVAQINKFYNKTSLMSKLPKYRTSEHISSLELFAEAELRVLSAILWDNCVPEYEELYNLFNNCKLDKPYMCGNQKDISNSNVGFYYSTVFLIVRSDALLYVPGMTGQNLKAVPNDNAFISLNETFRDKEFCFNRRNASDAKCRAATKFVTVTDVK